MGRNALSISARDHNLWGNDMAEVGEMTVPTAAPRGGGGTSP